MRLPPGLFFFPLFLSLFASFLLFFLLVAGPNQKSFEPAGLCVCERAGRERHGEFEPGERKMNERNRANAKFAMGDAVKDRKKKRPSGCVWDPPIN